MSVMSHSIIILPDISVSPMHPLVWHWSDADNSPVVVDRRCPIDGEINLACIEDHIAGQMWAKVSPHEANGGLNQGGPDLTVAKKVVKQLISAGKGDEARAVECLVLHGSWNGARPHPTPTDSRLRPMRSPLRLATTHSVDLSRQLEVERQVRPRYAVPRASGGGARYHCGVMPRSRAMQRPVRVRRA